MVTGASALAVVPIFLLIAVALLVMIVTFLLAKGRCVMWKWMSVLVLLAVALLWFWPEYQSLPVADRTVGDDKPHSLSVAASPITMTAEHLVVPATKTSAAPSCPEPKQLMVQLASLHASRQHQSATLQQLMQDAQLRPELQLQYLRELGGDIAVLRPQGRQAQDGLSLLRQQHQSMIRIATSELAQVKLATEQHDYRALQVWLQQYPQPADIPKLGYLHFTLLQVILQSDPQLQPVQLQQLLDSGFKAGFIDLLLVSRAGRDLQIVDMLQQSYGGDLTVSWVENQRLLNLALLAAQRGDTSMFDYWLAQGVPAAFGPLDDNAFDLLPLPASQDQLQQQLPLIRTLLRLQLAPVSTERQWFWLQQLPKPEAAQLQALLQLESVGVDPIGTAQSATVSQQLSQIRAQLSQTLTQLWQCQGHSQLPAIISGPEPDSSLQQILQDSDNLLRKVSTDTAQVAQIRKFEQTTTQMQQFIREANWQGLDAFMQAQVKDHNSVYFNNRSFAQEYMLHQMLQLQAPAMEIVKSLRFFGGKLPASVITFIQFSQDPELAPALQKAGYHIPALSQK